MFRTLVSTAALGIAALAAFSAAGPAQASITLPPFQASTECVSNGTVLDVSGPCTLGGATASFSPSPFAVVQASASGEAGLPSNGALSFMKYFYTIEGPDNGPIAVDIFADVLATTSNAENIGFASLFDTEGHQLCAQKGQIGCNDVSSLHGELIEMEEPGVLYSIQLNVEASENGAFGGSAFASADPFIGIDPQLTIDPELYKIILSDGVANGLPGAIPEPATWALMLAGFAGLGGALRRRRAVA
jgi:hypothetical protein